MFHKFRSWTKNSRWRFFFHITEELRPQTNVCLCFKLKRVWRTVEEQSRSQSSLPGNEAVNLDQTWYWMSVPGGMKRPGDTSPYQVLFERHVWFSGGASFIQIIKTKCDVKETISPRKPAASSHICIRTRIKMGLWETFCDLRLKVVKRLFVRTCVSHVGRSLFFSGIDFEGATVGLAFIGTLCSGHSVGVVQVRMRCGGTGCKTLTNQSNQLTGNHKYLDTIEKPLQGTTIKLKSALSSSQVLNEIKRESWRCVEGARVSGGPVTMSKPAGVTNKPGAESGRLVEHTQLERSGGAAEFLSDSPLGRDLDRTRTTSLKPSQTGAWSHPDWLRGERPKLLPLVNQESQLIWIHCDQYRKQLQLKSIETSRWLHTSFSPAVSVCVTSCFWWCV